MKLSHIISVVAYTALAVSSNAFAADDLINGSDAAFNATLPQIENDAYKPVEIGSGWYIRGDIGYNMSAKHNSKEYSLAPVNHQNDYRDAVTFGAGVGYRMNDMLRLEAGAEQIFSSKFKSSQAIAPEGPCNGRVFSAELEGWVPGDIENCIREDSAEYKALLTMANAYVDLGTYNGFAPFVGAGIGAARVSFREETGSIFCVPVHPEMNAEGCVPKGTADQPAPNVPYTQAGAVNADTEWRMAYSVSAGVAYDLSNNLKLDSTYRFTKIGSGGDIPYGETPGSSMARDGFSLHQVKMGLRYEIW
jgi:opacity protein-like surface antigen